MISHALQAAGYSAEHPAIARADAYLLSRQHTKLGDWSLGLDHPLPGGWGFSDVNTIIPDVDDTTAALRALRATPARFGPQFREARDRGLHWVLSMQNRDGGWPAFEKGKDSALLTRLLPVDAPKQRPSIRPAPTLQDARWNIWAVKRDSISLIRSFAAAPTG